MPLKVKKLETLKLYVENALSCRIYYSVDGGNRVRIMAGQLAWTGKLNDKEVSQLQEWLGEKEQHEEGRVIEVEGWMYTQEVFA